MMKLDMVIGVGIDLVEVKRIEEAVTRHGERFLRRVYTPAELAECWYGPLRYQRIASRFAAKEAVAKSIGAGAVGRWLDVETLRRAGGKPCVILRGRLLEAARAKGVKRIEVALSHTREFGLAQALALSEKTNGDRWE